MMLKYVDYDIVFQEIPDHVTLAINISGCPNGCEGCHSPYLMENVGEELTEAALSTLIGRYGSSITCLCFMGGDNSPDEVAALARFTHEQWPIKTAWYSGQTAFPTDSTAFDYVKLGRYQHESGGLRMQSTNQRLYARTNTNGWSDITDRFWR